MADDDEHEDLTMYDEDAKLDMYGNIVSTGGYHQYHQ